MKTRSLREARGSPFVLDPKFSTFTEEDTMAVRQREP